MEKIHYCHRVYDFIPRASKTSADRSDPDSILAVRNRILPFRAYVIANRRDDPTFEVKKHRIINSTLRQKDETRHNAQIPLNHGKFTRTFVSTEDDPGVDSSVTFQALTLRC